MRQGDARGKERGEGWLIAVAVGLVLAVTLGIWLNRQPRAMRAAPVHSASLERLERAARLDVNSASAWELESLPGVGPILAARIVEWREENGPFREVEALKEVPGIGEKTLETLRPRIRLD